MNHVSDHLALVLAQEVSTGGSIQYVEALVFTLGFLAFFGWVAKRVAMESDRMWLQRLVVWGYLAKVAGSLARYWMVTGLYESGDSYSYQIAGETYAHIWRSLVVPVSNAGAEGTAFTEVATGLLYAFYTPTFLGGFLLFATLAFLGQLLFYLAFRRWFGPTKQRLYAIAVFFLPSLIFWPSSIGKDALMVCFLGIAAFGASRLLITYRLFSSGLIIALGLILAAGVRPHVAGIFALSLVLAVLLGRAPEALRGDPKRTLLLVGSVAGAALVLATFSTTFEVGMEVDRTQTDIGGFLEDVSQQTSQGGSQIEGVAITTPARLPIAIVTVLFRPLLHEGTNLQVLASALEGTALLIIVIWKFPTMWKNKGLLRRKSYLTLSFFYTGGFIIAFSAILNLGIRARQRVQLLPFFLALIVGLGWPEDEEIEPEEESELETRTPIPPYRSAPYSTTRMGPQTYVEPAAEVELPEPESVPAPETDPITGSEREPEPEPDTTDQEPVIAPVPAALAKEPEADDPTEEEKPATRHGAGRTRVRDRIRPQVVYLRTNDPHLPIREIARIVEASPTTVRRVLVEEDLI